MIAQANRDLAHLLLMYECNQYAVFDEADLPEGLCNDGFVDPIEYMCMNLALGWTIGGAYVCCDCASSLLSIT